MELKVSVASHNRSMLSFRELGPYHLVALYKCLVSLALEECMAIHSSTLVWRIPWTEEPSGLQSMGLQRVRHDWSALAVSLEWFSGVCNYELGQTEVLIRFSYKKLTFEQKSSVQNSSFIWFYLILILSKRLSTSISLAIKWDTNTPSF